VSRRREYVGGADEKHQRSPAEPAHLEHWTHDARAFVPIGVQEGSEGGQEREVLMHDFPVP
jgi:hypothetical protein